MVELATIEHQPALEDHLAGRREELARKQTEVAAAKDRLTQLASDDQELVDAINVAQAAASAPEPRAEDFESLDAWHAAIRKWRTERPESEATMRRLHHAREQLISRSITPLKSEIAGLERESAWLEFELAKDEHLLAQRHADAMLVRVRRIQATLP